MKRIIILIITFVLLATSIYSSDLNDQLLWIAGNDNSEEEVLEIKLKELLAKGADVNAKDSYRGRTAWLLACTRGIIRLAKLLI